MMLTVIFTSDYKFTKVCIRLRYHFQLTIHNPRMSAQCPIKGTYLVEVEWHYTNVDLLDLVELI